MDQLAPLVSWIKKNIFWLGCGFLAIAMVAVWFLTTQTLAEETTTNENKLTSNIRVAKGILSVTAEDEVKAHPNSSSETGMKEELVKTVNAIVAAWRLREEAQKELLVWPEELGSDALIGFFEKYNPPERYPEILQKESQIQPGLELYGVNIPDRMNYLCSDEVLRAAWKWGPKNGDISRSDSKGGDKFSAGGGASPGGLTEDIGALENKKFAVIWSNTNQDLWHDKLTKFQGLDDNVSSSSSPTALQCYMLQQDLWILEAMFKIIRQVNGNSTANDLSSIKRLDHIAIGREAAGKLGELTEKDPTLGTDAVKIVEVEVVLTAEEKKAQQNAAFKNLKAGGAAKEPTEGRQIGMGSIGKGKNLFKAGAGEIDVSNLPFEGRYVDLNFEPLSAQQVQDIIMGKTLPEQNLELIVAKRVPVRIALRMDENKIAEFMAACANSPFAFEIQQVRLNKHKPGGEVIEMAGKGKGNSAQDKLKGMGTSIGSGEESNSIQLTSRDVEVRTNYDVDVEFYGIVKIYNPVREDFLYEAIGLKKDGSDANESNADDATLNP